MPHQLKIKMPAMEVVNRDVTVEVATKETKDAAAWKMGEVQISRGNIQWKPRDHSTTKYQLSWKDFAEMMRQHGKEVKR